MSSEINSRLAFFRSQIGNSMSQGSARIGEVLTARAAVIRAGKNVVHCECRIVNTQGKIIAEAATNLIQTGVKLPF